ncbi:unnamed protein product [Pleuronectes platessa]|uniref:Uncharacterized protein n=1 Tax=Pleuronectes platessa TaxID=8262 RepID=A0A9N7UZ41_PLEPL|nr:unnamed protein product [Pleuronectes platessa]
MYSSSRPVIGPFSRQSDCGRGVRRRRRRRRRRKEESLWTENNCLSLNCESWRTQDVLWVCRCSSLDLWLPDRDTEL